MIIIFVCLGLGVLLKRLRVFPDEAPLTLNDLIIYVSLPALSLLHIPEIELNPTLLVPISTAWLVFITAMIIFPLIGKIFGWDKATIGCLILCCGLFNSSFVGFPVMKALYGEEGLKLALMVDQPGSFVVLSTLGIITAVWYSSGRPSSKEIFKKLFSFPPLLAFIAAVLLKAIGFHHTEMTTSVLKPLGAMITPVALISVGMQLDWSQGLSDVKALVVGLGYRLILSPLLLLLLFYGVFSVTGLPLKVSIMEAAMAPMITGAILASRYNLNPKLANLFIGIGIPVSFATLAGWYYVVEQL